MKDRRKLKQQTIIVDLQHPQPPTRNGRLEKEALCCVCPSALPICHGVSITLGYMAMLTVTNSLFRSSPCCKEGGPREGDTHLTALHGVLPAFRDEAAGAAAPKSKQVKVKRQALDEKETTHPSITKRPLMNARTTFTARVRGALLPAPIWSLVAARTEGLNGNHVKEKWLWILDADVDVLVCR